MKRAKDSGCSLRRKREVKEEELKKNEDAILKFVNISSDAMSPNEMHEVSSDSTRKSIPEVGKKQCLAKLEIMKKLMLRTT